MLEGRVLEEACCEVEVAHHQGPATWGDDVKQQGWA